MKKIILTIAILFFGLLAQTQTLIPIPIPMGSGGGGPVPEHLFLSMYLTFNILIIASATIRYFIVKRDPDFHKQSKLKNFFYELDEWYNIDPPLNIPSFGFLVLHVFAITFLLIDFFIKIL